MAEKKTKKKTSTRKSQAQKELEQENKTLKERLAEVLNYAKDLENKKAGGDLTHSAIGCSKDEDGNYRLDFIKYNPETKEALVDKTELVAPNPKSYHGMLHKLGMISELEISKNVEEKK